MTTTYGFKAMNADMTCRDYQFEIGKTYQINNEKPLKLCSDSGFHFCLNIEECYNNSCELRFIEDSNFEENYVCQFETALFS